LKGEEKGFEKSTGNKKKKKKASHEYTFTAPGESQIYSAIQDVHDDIEDGLPLVLFTYAI
jgi:hypothetical protein